MNSNQMCRYTVFLLNCLLKMAHISKPTLKIVFVIRHFVHYEWIFEMTH